MDKIRREETEGSTTVSSSPVKTESGETITIPGYGQDDLTNNWYDESNNGDDDGGIEILPFFGGNGNENDDGMQSWTEFPITTSTSPSNNNSFKSSQGNNTNTSSGEVSKMSIYPATTMVGQNAAITSNGGSDSAVTVTEVNTSNSIQSQSFVSMKV